MNEVEAVGFAMWKAEADRAAPNVGKNRTIENYRYDLDPIGRAKWDQIAQAAIAALDAARGDPVARVVEWLRKDADQTEIEAGHIVKNSSGNPRKNAAEWAMLVAMKRGLADAIERGEPFNG